MLRCFAGAGLLLVSLEEVRSKEAQEAEEGKPSRPPPLQLASKKAKAKKKATTKVRKTHLFAPFYTRNDRFTKTRSGHEDREGTQKERCVFIAGEIPVAKGHLLLLLLLLLHHHHHSSDTPPPQER
eukprot:COSAG06_NODE_10353_length_1696_cov_24.868503_3_plen_126_part_00